MKWFLIQSSELTGSANMEMDFKLSQEVNKESAFLRLYRWKPYCISIGTNQNINEINQQKTFEDSLDIVRRPTGGRAVLHAEELTYAVILSIQNYSSVKEIYNNISLSLKKGLTNYNPLLEKIEIETSQSGYRESLKSVSSSLCFASTTKYEFKANGKKLIGSAQRKFKNSILQHGSILCGKFHRKLPEYLNLSDEEIVNLKDEISNKTIEIETVLDKPVDYVLLSKSLVTAFEEVWNMKFSK